MRTRVGLHLAWILPFCLASFPTHAHHSFAMFDESQCLSVKGSIRKFQWAYPHMWVWLNADSGADAEPVLYGFEGGDPASLAMSGWTPTILKKGDKVTVLFNPLHDGRKGGSLRQVILADGSVLAAQVSGSADEKYFRACKPS